MREPRSEADWRKTIAAFEASGEKVAAFCARRDINANTLSWWRSRLRRHGTSARGRAGVELVPVDVTAPAPPVKPVTTLAVVVGDAEIQFTTQVDVDYVAALVGALRSRC